MSKAAKLSDMEGLHAFVAKLLKEQLKLTDDDGRVSPQLLAQAIKFLKDNGIEAAKGSNNAAIKALSDRVEALSDEDPDAVSELYN